MLKAGAAAKRWCWLASVLAVGCSDLPDDQLLTSPHFRYHARADAVLDPTIMDRLEAHRAAFDARYGVDPGVVDYYLFRDPADLGANSPCPAGTECTDQRSVMASIPFHEHELVHAFLSDSGSPAPVVAEGFAQYAACIYPRRAYRVPPEQWPVAVGASSTDSIGDASVEYNFGQRLVAWMMAAGGPKRLLDFYHRSFGTTDAAVFALQFERFWDRRLGDVADELELHDLLYRGSSCPCTAPALPEDGSAASFVALQDYRTVGVAEESRLELTSDGGQLVFPFDCASTAGSGPALAPNDASGSALTIARVGSGRYGVTTAYNATGTAVVHQSQNVAHDWSCDTAAANPVALGGREITASVTPGVDGLTWFAFTLDGDAELEFLDLDAEVVICPTCAEARSAASPCGIPEIAFRTGMTTPVKRPPSGTILVGLLTHDVALRPSLSVRLRPAP
jgi:hypothetical protein